MTELLLIRCNFDTGETLLCSVLRVVNPEGYRTLAWTSVKGVSKRKLVIGRKQGFNKRKCNSPIFDTFVCVRNIGLLHVLGIFPSLLPSNPICS